VRRHAIVVVAMTHARRAGGSSRCRRRRCACCCRVGCRRVWQQVPPLALAPALRDASAGA
jgi:hypothetical protein